MLLFFTHGVMRHEDMIPLVVDESLCGAEFRGMEHEVSFVKPGAFSRGMQWTQCSHVYLSYMAVTERFTVVLSLTYYT